MHLNNYNLVDMHDRPVIMRPVRRSNVTDLEHDECADCGEPSQYVIYEITQVQTLNPDRFKPIWFWCGICDVGA